MHRTITDLASALPAGTRATQTAQAASLHSLAADTSPACLLVFNAIDPSGAGGLTGDALTAAAIGAHVLPVATGAWARDSARVFDHFALDEEAVAEQARAALEDVRVQAIKAGFLGTPANVGVVAEIAADYADLPLVAWMPDLSWWEGDAIDAYLDAARELLLPQAALLVGAHGTLARWLLPDWAQSRPPGPRDLARAAAEAGCSCTLVTGIALPGQFVDNVLATPQSLLCSGRFELFDASFSGAGDTLSAALAALLAQGTELAEATGEALQFLDQALDAGFRPGMGNALPDRMFWAQPDAADGDEGSTPDAPPAADTDAPPDEASGPPAAPSLEGIAIPRHPQP